MESVFYAKFHDIKGPTVICEVACERGRPLPPAAAPASGGGGGGADEDGPREAEACEAAETDELDAGPLSADDGAFFERVSDFIIAKKQLCESLLTVSDDVTQCKVMSYPMYIENPDVYKRNALFFSFGFVFKEDMQTGAYEAVLKKLSHVMRSVEIESYILSRPENEPRVKEILSQVVSELSFYGESIVAVDDRNVLALKITPRLVDPTDVLDHQVPVQTRQMANYVSKEWDLTIQQVIRYMDGERHVRLIAEESGVAVALVRRCVRQLLYFRCVRLVDIFQYSNSYTCTPRLVELAEDRGLQQDCLRFVYSGTGELPDLGRVFGLYARLQPCLTLKDFCMLEDPVAQSVNPRRLITFGVLHSLIRRVHVYPVAAPSFATVDAATDISMIKYQKELAAENAAVLDRLRKVRTDDDFGYGSIFSARDEQSTNPDPDADGAQPLEFLIDGQHNFDSICTELWCASADLRKTLAAEDEVVFINTN